MWFIELGTICVTVAVVVRVWWLVVQVLRARNKRRLLSRMFGAWFPIRPILSEFRRFATT